MANMLLKRIKDWATSITSFRTGDVIPVDGPSGTAKMSKDDLLKAAAQNALAGNVAPEFVPNSTTTAVDYPYVYNGSLYVAKETYQGPWDASKFTKIDISFIISKNDKFIDTADDNLFNIVDNNGYIIAYWDKDGVLHTSGCLTAPEVKDLISTEILKNNKFIDTADDNLFNIVDNNGYIIAYWDKDGVLHTNLGIPAPEDTNLAEEIILPTKIYTYNGDLLQLFKYPMLTGHAHTDLDWSFYIQSSDTTISKKCRALERYTEIQLTNTGTFTIHAQLNDRFLNVIDERTFDVEVLPVVNPEVPVNVLLIGDSITQGVTNNSGISVAQGASEAAEYPYSIELKRLLSSDAGTNAYTAGLSLSNVHLIGTRNTSTGRNEGYGGWTPASFMGTASPFYINGGIDFNAYLDQDGVYDDPSHKGVDIIYILLGANVGVNVQAVDGRYKLATTTYKSQMTTLINAIKSQLIDDSSAQYYNPNLKIVLLSYSLPFTSGNGYHPYGSRVNTAGNWRAKRYHAYSIANFELKETYNVSNVDAVELSGQIDSENAYAYIMKPVNVYSETTEKVLIEQVHPNSNGYKQYAKAVLRDLLHRI